MLFTVRTWLEQEKSGASDSARSLENECLNAELLNALPQHRRSLSDAIFLYKCHLKQPICPAVTSRVKF